MTIALHDDSTRTPWHDISFVTHVATRCVRAFCTGALITFAALTVMLVGLDRLSGGEAGLSILGREVLIVRSGSMVPQFATGDAVIIRPVSRGEATELVRGDIVTFRTSVDNPTLVSHRIVEVTRDAQGGVAYVTRGDANASRDSTVLEPDRIVGVVTTHVSRGGYILHALQEPRLLLTLVIAFIFANLAVLMTRPPIHPETQPTTEKDMSHE